MNIPAQARKDIKLVASMLKGLVALDEALDEAGSLDKMAVATQARIDALQVTESGLAGLIAKAQEEADAIKAKAVSDAKSADGLIAQANQILDDARSQASTILSDSKLQSEQILSVAKQEAEDLKTSKNAEIAALDELIGKAKQSLDGIASGVIAAEKRKAEVEKGIDQLVRKFTGA